MTFPSDITMLKWKPLSQRRTWVLILCLLGFSTGCSEGQSSVKFSAKDQTVKSGEQESWAFDKDTVDTPPTQAEIFNGQWVVRKEDDAPTPAKALCQTATETFPAIKLSDAVYGDVVVSMKFKPISGKMDQAAGIITRVQDQENYYIVRANALEGNVSFYKYAGGKRSFIKEDNAKVVAGAWQTLKVEAKGNTLKAFLNNQPVVEITDDDFRAGHIGLWTKADSVTCFDDVQAIAQ